MNGPVSARLAAATTLGITWARGVAYLHAGHPHEDAFILFRYAEHLAGGHGIVFNIGGAPTEGATDFLWMVLIAAGNVLGLDSARGCTAAHSRPRCGAPPDGGRRPRSRRSTRA